MSVKTSCSTCSQVDDHPKHIVIRVMDVSQLAPENSTASMLERLESAYNTSSHLDCCNCHEEDAVQVESCSSVLDRAGGVKGKELRDYLANNPRKLVA